ncbi:MAG: uracil-DNA glycosylase [Bdellovibrionales bacterium]
MSDLKLENSWKIKLEPQFQMEYMKKLKTFLQSRKKERAVIYPKGEDYFAALNATSFDKVKVVILGQDPYHGSGQAHGLSFSVLPGVPFPPSLLNIFKELQSDLGIPIPQSGCLKKWAEQGVLLLNSVLTVEDGKPAAHQGKGWEKFTDTIVQLLNDERQNLVFVLWGSYAQKKGALIDRSKHFVIESVHPSPLSAYRGFLGSRPFSKINNYLKSQGSVPIDWKIE